jgi:hypothetical protein
LGFTTVNSTLDVFGATNTRGLSNLTGGFSNAGGITNVTGDINNAGSLINDGSAIIGNSTAGSTLTVSNGTGASGTTFSVDGNTGNTAISGQLRVTEATTLDGATQINNTLGVTEATTLGSSLNVVGLTTTAGITNTGAITNTGTLTNTGDLAVISSGAGNGTLNVNDTSSSLLFGSNGMTATASSLVLQGGTASTTLTLNDSGASFANTAGSAPVTVTGVANGTSQFDAVNYGQLSTLESEMSAGIASIAAIANIPAPPSGKRFAIGGAVGGFNGETAFAIGGTANVTTEVVVKASVGFSDGRAAFGAGAAYAW